MSDDTDRVKKMFDGTCRVNLEPATIIEELKELHEAFQANTLTREHGKMLHACYVLLRKGYPLTTNVRAMLSVHEGVEFFPDYKT